MVDAFETATNWSTLMNKCKRANGGARCFERGRRVGDGVYSHLARLQAKGQFIHYVLFSGRQDAWGNLKAVAKIKHVASLSVEMARRPFHISMALGVTTPRICKLKKVSGLQVTDMLASLDLTDE